MQAAFDDQREIDDENGDKQHRQHDEYDRCDKTAAISLCRLRRLLRVILLHGLAPQRKSMDTPLFPSQYCAKTIISKRTKAVKYLYAKKFGILSQE